MNNLKNATKFIRSGSNWNNAHTPHYVIITEIKEIGNKYDLLNNTFFNKKDAKMWAKKNLKDKYYEIHKDWFVE